MRYETGNGENHGGMDGDEMIGSEVKWTFLWVGHWREFWKYELDCVMNMWMEDYGFEWNGWVRKKV